MPLLPVLKSNRLIIATLSFLAVLLLLPGGLLHAARNRKPAHRLAYTVTQTVLHRFPLEGRAAVSDIEWSPNGQALAVARAGGQVLLLPERKVLRNDTGEASGSEVRLWWSPDGKRLATVGATLEQVLELVDLATGETRALGDGSASVGWLSELPASDPQDWRNATAGLVCVKEFPPLFGVTLLTLPYISERPEDRFPFSPLLLNTRGVITALSPDGKVLVSRLINKSGRPEGAFVIWRVRLYEGRILWSRTVRPGMPEYYSYDRVAWSEPLQAVALSFAGATDGESFRRLYVVTRSRVTSYSGSIHYETPPHLNSDPIWLGNQVIFAEGGWDHIEAPDRKWTNVISSFEVPRKKHRVLFSRADDYRAPAVSPDNTKLAFAEERGGKWEVVVVAVK